MIRVVEATQNDINTLAPLFDAYRVFYEQESDLEGATTFLKDRMKAKQSLIFMALYANEVVGFVQLYPSFSSVSMQRILILNDLFVDTAYRNCGAGGAMLQFSQDYSRENGYKGLALETGIHNPAQQLYERMGWEKDVHCFHYFWTA